MKTTARVAELIAQAQALGLTARAITQPRGGYRKHHTLGSTHSPRRVVIISDHAFSHGGAKQFLQIAQQKENLK